MKERKSEVKLRITPLSGEAFDVAVTDESNSRAEAEQISRTGAWNEGVGTFYPPSSIASVQLVAVGHGSWVYLGGQYVNLGLDDG